MQQKPKIDYRVTKSRERCGLCGAHYGTSYPMFTRDYEAWVCTACVRESFLCLVDQGMAAIKAGRKDKRLGPKGDSNAETDG